MLGVLGATHSVEEKRLRRVTKKLATILGDALADRLDVSALVLLANPGDHGGKAALPLLDVLGFFGWDLVRSHELQEFVICGLVSLD